MTTSHRASPSPVPSFPSFRRRLVLYRAGTLLARWYDRHLQRTALADLDDRLLADIGKSPGEARRECAKPFWRK